MKALKWLLRHLKGSFDVELVYKSAKESVKLKVFNMLTIVVIEIVGNLLLLMCLLYVNLV